MLIIESIECERWAVADLRDNWRVDVLARF